MPDVVTEGPFVALLRALGPEGVQTRTEVTGQVPVSVCLFHGVHGVSVAYGVFTPMLGPFVLGKPVTVMQVQVRRYPQCGYRLDWAPSGYLPG